MEPGPVDAGHGQAAGWGDAPLWEQYYQKKEQQPDHRGLYPLHLPTSLVWEEDSAWAVAEELGVAAWAVDSGADNR